VAGLPNTSTRSFPTDEPPVSDPATCAASAVAADGHPDLSGFWSNATLTPEQTAVMLDWVIETQGYTVTPLDTAGASDELLVQRLVEYLTEHPATATKHVCAAVEGTDSRLVALLKDRPEFDACPGPHGASLWMLATTSAEGQAQ